MSTILAAKPSPPCEQGETRNDSRATLALSPCTVMILKTAECSLFKRFPNDSQYTA